MNCAGLFASIPLAKMNSYRDRVFVLICASQHELVKNRLQAFVRMTTVMDCHIDNHIAWNPDSGHLS